MSVINKILFLFTPKERRQCYVLMAMILVMAFLDTVGVASIMPFMAVLGDPEIVKSNKWLAWAYQIASFKSSEDFLFFLGGLVFIVLVVSISFKALTQYMLLRFTHMQNHYLACRLFQGYLCRPYAWFLNRHSADLGKSMLSEVSQVIGGVIIPAMQFMAHGTVALFLITLLVMIDPFLAISITAVLGGTYIIIFIVIRRYLTKIGKDRVLANKERFQIAQEALGGIKEVKIFGREQAFYAQFVKPSHRFANHQANNTILSQMPRYLLELTAFGGVLLVTLYLLRAYGEFQQMLPALALYTFAGYRLLPALQNVYGEMTKLRFNLPSLDVLFKDIEEVSSSIKPTVLSSPAPLNVNIGIVLEGITFTYPKADKPSLLGLSLDIPARSTIGLVGSTGAGKTTVVDIMLGLLSPCSGRILVDRQSVIDENEIVLSSGRFSNEASVSLKRWQRTIGYVPQNIYLIDDSIAANIAFGIIKKDVNMEMVIRAAKIAELHEFVNSELPNGYHTLVGERGVRLSGGQRQRIGIARALYHDPAVLIFDEATSALDNVTEQAVMSAVNNLGREKTIILIAHRLTTVQKCDCIYILERGCVVGKGTYSELLSGNVIFRQLAHAAKKINEF